MVQLPDGVRIRSLATLVGVIALAARAAAAQEPPPTFGVSGTVLDVARQPVVGAEVRLLLDNERGAKLADTARTDASGRFLARGWIVSRSDGEGEWRVEVRADRHAVSVVDEIFCGYRVKEIGPVFVFDPVPVRGRITDGSGKPVVGAAVRFAHGGASWSRRDYARASPDATSNADGYFEFRSAPPGSATLGVSAPGFADAMVHDLVLRTTQPNVVDVRLAPERALSGTVVDRGCVPITGASIDVPTRAFWRTEASTDSQGHFRVEGLGSDWDGKWSAQALGFVGKDRDGVPAPDEPLSLERSRSIEVRVTRDGAGPPPVIRSFTVLDGRAPGGCGMMDTSIEVRPNLTTVQNIEPGACRFFWEASLFHHDFVQPAAGVIVSMTDGSCVPAELPDRAHESEPVLLSAPATGGITGRVIREGDHRPVAGTTVMTNYWSVIEPDLVAVTDAEGRFSFEGMKECELHDLTVDNESWYGRVRQVAVRAGETTTGVELVVRPQPRIVGRVSVAGKAPGEPVVIGLGEFQDNEVVPAGWFGLGVSDAAGCYSVIPQYDRRFTVVPKRPTRPEDGGYRRFPSEFPETPWGKWNWQADAPSFGDVLCDVNMAEWK